MKYFVNLILIGMFWPLCAQQTSQYSQWSYHQFSFNPAHAGIKPCIDLHTLYRMQWVGFEGAPRSGFLTASVPLYNKRKKYLGARHGTGFRFENDRIGAFAFNRINFAYAGHFNFSESNRLSLGLYAGMVQMGYDPSYATTSEADPTVMNETNFARPDASFGAWYNSTNYYFGLSLQNLIPFKWESVGISSMTGIHTLLNAGYRYQLNEQLSLLPLLFIKIPPRGPMAADLNLQLDYKGFLNIGIGYRNTDALIAMASIRLFDQLSIAYSFDYTLSEIQSVSRNTHEVSLRLTTCKTPRQSSSACPLFE